MKKSYIILIKHMLFGIWFVKDELRCTEEELVTLIQSEDPTRVKVIEGDFVKFKFTTEIDKESREAIFQKHSQGQVFDEKENNKGSV